MRILPTWINDACWPANPAHDSAAREQRIAEQQRRHGAVLWEEFAKQETANRRVIKKPKGGWRPRRPCWCVETGEKFQSLAAAGRSVGVEAAAIFGAIRDGYAVARKHWTDKPLK